MYYGDHKNNSQADHGAEINILRGIRQTFQAEKCLAMLGRKFLLLSCNGARESHVDIKRSRGKGGNTRMPNGISLCLNMLRNIISSVKPDHLSC